MWQSLLSVRQLVLPMEDDMDNWMKFASLCRKSGRIKQAHRMLVQLLGGWVSTHTQTHTHTHTHTRSTLLIWLHAHLPPSHNHTCLRGGRHFVVMCVCVFCTQCGPAHPPDQPTGSTDAHIAVSPRSANQPVKCTQGALAATCAAGVPEALLVHTRETGSSALEVRACHRGHTHTQTRTAKASGRRLSALLMLSRSYTHGQA